MPRERDPPYICAGFREDATTIIGRYAEKQTVGFTEFAEIWRDLKFSTIFMGRETLKELTEFTEECFRNTLLFMSTSNSYQKVGAVYLLYSLYLKQPHILETPVPIKISPKQLFEMYELENYFLEGSSDPAAMELSFVITKLCKIGAFHISVFPIPMGPVVPIPLLRLEPLRTSNVKEALGSLNMINEKDVKNIVAITQEYEKIKKNLPYICSSSKAAPGLNRYNDLKETISEFEERYNAGLLPNKMSGDVKIEEEFRSLGQRRARLKSQQYEKAAGVGMSRKVRASSESSSNESAGQVKRGPGRPRKKISTRGRKKKATVVEIKTEIESEVDDDVEAETVDNPGASSGPSPRAPQKKPFKFPRPVRKHYFEDD